MSEAILTVVILLAILIIAIPVMVIALVMTNHKDDDEWDRF